MIVDASVALKWFFAENDNAAANAIADRDDIRAPTFLMIELGNAFWKKWRRGEVGGEADFAAKLAVASDAIELSDDRELVPRAIEIAIELDHPVYDCVYLALAEQLNDVVVSADARLLGKVRGTRWEARVAPLVAADQDS